MKNKYIKLFLVGTVLMSSLTGCGDSWFERDSKTILTDEQVWNDPMLIKSQLANIYNRLPQLHGDFNTGGMSETDDAMFTGTNDQNYRNEIQYASDYGRYWDYSLMRDINMSIEKIAKFSTQLSETDRTLFTAEFRFQRAFIYFEMVKRMGGVPLITKTLEYDFNGDPSYLRSPRAKEHEIYDFIYTETQQIKEVLSAYKDSKTRANKYAALALQSRAMLYAASIAKYNNLMEVPIATDGGEVGMPASMANDYYQKSLDASKEIIEHGPYSLYDKVADKGKNFYDMLMVKNANEEIIFAKDYLTLLKTHRFTYDNIVRSFTEDNEASSALSPSLSLVESFDYLDGTKGTLRFKDEDGNYVVYDHINDIFANKDGRLYGTIVYAGSTFRGGPVNIQAGVATWKDGQYVLSVGDKLGSNYKEDGGVWTGLDGPRDNTPDVSNTGFYLRKFVSEAPGASARGVSAENWWPWFRLGEIYLNAAEAALELGTDDPEFYVNKLRKRAGFPENSIATLTMDILRNERRVELAFEDHRYYDLKRWRMADKIWNGVDNTDNTIVYGLYPYRIYNPGQPDHNKFIFDKMRPTRFKKPRYFQMKNYYSSIEQKVIDNNPQIVRNPFHN